MRNRIKITTSLMIIGILGLIFVQQLLNFDRLGNKIVSSRELRLHSHIFAEEIRRSSDEITANVRLYTITSDSLFRARFQEVADIREGRKPRAQESERLILEALLGAGMPLESEEEVVSLMEMASRIGFSSNEYATLKQAKKITDQMAQLEQSVVFDLGKIPDAADIRLAALELLVSKDFQSMKSEVLALLRKFEGQVSDRTAASIEAANEQTTRIRYSLFGLGILLAGLTMGGLLMEGLRAARYEGRAQRDSLTNSSSREYLHEHLAKVTGNAEARGEIVLLAFIDLNGFKRINDQFGHKRGDRLLREVANCLQDECRKRDFVARYGGDEFVIVFVSAMNQRRESIERMKQTIERAFGNLSKKAGVDGIGGSAGISVFPCRAATADALIQKADHAMFEAKNSGELVAICVHEEENGLAYAC